MKRQSLLPRVLSVSEGSAVCRKPFKPPCSNGYTGQNDQLARRLWARKRFVPWGSSRPALVAITNHLDIPESSEKGVVEEIVTLPPGIDPLVLWQSEELAANMVQIVVDPLLVRFLRPHQRYFQDVQFRFCIISIISGNIFLIVSFFHLKYIYHCLNCHLNPDMYPLEQLTLKCHNFENMLVAAFIGVKPQDLQNMDS